MQSESDQTQQAPRGREAVVRALLTAATQAFAERGIEGASVREVAAAAGVNHALVFRHFGSKERLVRAVLDQLLDDLLAEFRGAGVDPSSLAAFGEEIADRVSLWKLLTRAVLDGEVDFLTGRSFPEIDGVLDAVERAGRAGILPRAIDARMLLLIVFSGGLGWVLLDPVLAETVGVPGTTPARRRELVRAAFAELLGSLPRGTTVLTGEEARAARVPAAARVAASPGGGRRKAASTSPSGPPRGREEVSRALVEAAMTLFAARGPAAVSVREIAARAGVNHALVFRHFGSKDGLVRAVWERVLEDLAGRVVGAPDYEGLTVLTEALAESETIWKLLARAILDGESPTIASYDYGFVDGMLSAVARGQESGALATQLHPRLIVAMVLAMGFGWLVFHPVLMPLLGMPTGEGVALRAELRAAVVRLLGWTGTPDGA